MDPVRAERAGSGRPLPDRACARFIIRRVLWGIVLLFGVSLLTFVIFFCCRRPIRAAAGRRNLAPGQVELITRRLSAGQGMVRAVLGLHERLVLHFGFGASYSRTQPVRQYIFVACRATISLAAGACPPVRWSSASASGSSPRAAAARASTARRWVPRSSPISAPPVLGGLVTLYLFVRTPVGGSRSSPARGSYVGLRVSPLHWFTGAAAAMDCARGGVRGDLAPLLHGNLIEVMSEDHDRTARARGCLSGRVIMRPGSAPRSRRVAVPASTSGRCSVA